MRSEEEMFALIMSVAQDDDRIRAVYLNGSRANSCAPKDIFQDYDIVYAVTETKPFYESSGWIDVFGKRLYMQCPDEIDQCLGLETDFDACYGWLIQFEDGNRLDLHVVPIESADPRHDEPYKILLDKDGAFSHIPLSSDTVRGIAKPTQETFQACCNEFWWCTNNVAKSLWREEIPYAHTALYEACQPQLIQLLHWKIGCETGFRASIGKASRYLQCYLDEATWDAFLETYSDGKQEHLWKATFAMCELFDKTALEVERHLGFAYDAQEAQAAYGFLKRVHGLPSDAESL